MTNLTPAALKKLTDLVPESPDIVLDDLGDGTSDIVVDGIVIGNVCTDCSDDDATAWPDGNGGFVDNENDPVTPPGSDTNGDPIDPDTIYIVGPNGEFCPKGSGAEDNVQVTGDDGNGNGTVVVDGETVPAVDGNGNPIPPGTDVVVDQSDGDVVCIPNSEIRKRVCRVPGEPAEDEVTDPKTGAVTHEPVPVEIGRTEWLTAPAAPSPLTRIFEPGAAAPTMPIFRTITIDLPCESDVFIEVQSGVQTSATTNGRLSFREFILFDGAPVALSGALRSETGHPSQTVDHEQTSFVVIDDLPAGVHTIQLQWVPAGANFAPSSGFYIVSSSDYLVAFDLPNVCHVP